MATGRDHILSGNQAYAVAIATDILTESIRALRQGALIEDIVFERLKTEAVDEDGDIVNGTIVFSMKASGSMPVKRSRISIAVDVKDGYVTPPHAFQDAAGREHLLTKESIERHIHGGMMDWNQPKRQPNAELSLTDRTILPTTPARNFFNLAARGAKAARVRVEHEYAGRPWVKVTDVQTGIARYVRPYSSKLTHVLEFDTEEQHPLAARTAQTLDDLQAKAAMAGFMVQYDAYGGIEEYSFYRAGEEGSLMSPLTIVNSLPEAEAWLTKNASRRTAQHPIPDQPEAPPVFQIRGDPTFYDDRTGTPLDDQDYHGPVTIYEGTEYGYGVGGMETTVGKHTTAFDEDYDDSVLEEADEIDWGPDGPPEAGQRYLLDGELFIIDYPSFPTPTGVAGGHFDRDGRTKAFNNDDWRKAIESGSLIKTAEDNQGFEWGSDELAEGFETEMEHADSVPEDENVADITVDHLEEDPDYYEKLEKVEGAAGLAVGDKVVYDSARYGPTNAVVTGTAPSTTSLEGITEAWVTITLTEPESGYYNQETYEVMESSLTKTASRRTASDPNDPGRLKAGDEVTLWAGAWPDRRSSWKIGIVQGPSPTDSDSLSVLWSGQSTPEDVAESLLSRVSDMEAQGGISGSRKTAVLDANGQEVSVGAKVSNGISEGTVEEILPEQDQEEAGGELHVLWESGYGGMGEHRNVEWGSQVTVAAITPMVDEMAEPGISEQRYDGNGPGAWDAGSAAWDPTTVADGGTLTCPGCDEVVPQETMKQYMGSSPDHYGYSYCPPCIEMVEMYENYGDDGGNEMPRTANTLSDDLIVEGEPVDAEVLDFDVFEKTEPTDALQMDGEFEVQTLEGPMEGKDGDWLARGPKGELYPIDGEVFDQTYKPA